MPPQVGGRLSFFSHRWELVTSDTWVLQTVSDGYRLEFTSSPPHFSGMRTTNLPMDAAKRLALTKEVDQLVAKNAVEIVPREDVTFFSTFFLTPKKSGAWRPILNLKGLNKYIRPPPFKMESLAAVLPELSRGWWAVSLDLKDAYLHVLVQRSFRKWLGFAIGKTVYRFRSLPFGLSTAPRTFTRVVKAIAEHLRRRGIFVFVYLDDWLITAPSPQMLLTQVQLTVDLVRSLGFLVNEEKSELTPSQTIQFLGSRLEFAEGMVFPTEERVLHTTQCAKQLLTEDKPSARSWMRLLGLIASLKSMLPQSILRMRIIQLHVLARFRSHRHSLGKKIEKSPQVTKELRWWTRPSNIRRGRKFVSSPPSSTLTTDASKSGWGAHWGKIQMSGIWPKALAKKHINLLELWAIHLALRKLKNHLRNQTVLIRCDNMSVVMYINKRGGVRSRELCLQTVQLLYWCDRHQISIQAAHIPGAENKLADSLSRISSSIIDKPRVRGSSVEWHLNPSVCRMVFNKLQRPLIDLFASNKNHQLPTYCTWAHDEGAYAQDAFTISWKGTIAYAFPPIALIPRVLEKLENSEVCDLIMIAPKWPRQPWFPRLLTLLVDCPVALPDREDLIRTQEGAFLPQGTRQALSLTVWPLSSVRTRRQDFRSKLLPLLERQGDQRPDELTIQESRNTSGGAKGPRLIHIEHL